jgi:hypothetical protein
MSGGKILLITALVVAAIFAVGAWMVDSANKRISDFDKLQQRQEQNMNDFRDNLEEGFRNCGGKVC